MTNIFPKIICRLLENIFRFPLILFLHIFEIFQRKKSFEMDLICGYSEESSSEEEAPEEVEEEKPKKPKVWLPPPDLTTASMKERFRIRIM